MPERVKYPFRKTKPFSAIQLEEVSTMLSMKKQRGLGNKPNAAQPVETEDLFFFLFSLKDVVVRCNRPSKSSLSSPSGMWNSVTHLGMRGFKEQPDYHLSDFTLTEQYIKHKERQTKNRHGDEPTATKRVRKYKKKIWKTDGEERDPHRAFIEYVGHRPKGDNVPGNFYPSPVDSLIANFW